MKLSEIWKENMSKILTMVYADKIPKATIDNYLDKVVSSKEADFPLMCMRNLYTRINFDIPLNDVLDIVKSEELCIGANGTLTYSYKKIKTPIPDLLIKMKADRKVFKKKALGMEEKIGECKKSGIPIDPNDVMQLKYFDNIQTKIKQDMNSFYGVQSLKTSFIYNPDTASMITAQARQLISEMLWSIERFIGGNTPFGSISEFFSYCNLTLAEKHNTSIYDNLITYIPTEDDIKARAIDLLSNVPDFKANVEGLTISLFHFIKNLTERDRIYIYYKNNLKAFLIQNPKVFKILDEIISSDIEFMNPGVGKFEGYLFEYEKIHKCKLEGANLEKLKVEYTILTTNLQHIIAVLNEFVISHMSTPDRVFKYMNKKRKNIIISDTDSIIINIDPFVELCNSLVSKPFDSFDDETTDFKVVNIGAFLCTEITKIAGKIYCTYCNIPEELHSFIEMKNEFLFKRVVLYKNVKKNYVAHTRLREGAFVDKISSTGIKLRGSSITPQVQKMTTNLIENEILRSKKIDPIKILSGIKIIEEDIKNKINNGDKTFGRRCRFSGEEGYKTGVLQNGPGRGSLIWNILNPDNQINVGEYGYLFKTKIHTVEDLEIMKDIDEDMYDKMKNKIFSDEGLRKYGLSMLCIPLDSSIKLPQWFIKIIDIEDIVNKQTQPIISLLPSIGLYNSRISATKSALSSIISF